MNRFLGFAALIAGALAGSEDGGGAFSVPSYTTATAQVSSYMAASAMSSMMSSMSSSMSMSMSSSMMSSMMSSMKPTTTWQAWPTTTAMATQTAVAATSSMTASPSLITISSVAMPTTSGWPSSPMATHTVMIGGSSLVYTPPSLSGVKDKDTILFLFLQKNHTITQSSFAMPCDMSEKGFTSGFMPSDGTVIPFILVEFSDSMHTGTPMWLYCDQGDHCQRGMRFSINAPNDKDMAWRAMNTISATSTMTTSSSMKMSSSMMTSSSMMMSMSMSSSTMSKPMASASIVPGTGTMNNGQCMCDCLCGVNAFPAGAGMGMMGGMPGMIPASAAPSMTGAAMSSGMAYGSGSGW